MSNPEVVVGNESTLSIIQNLKARLNMFDVDSKNFSTVNFGYVLGEIDKIKDGETLVTVREELIEIQGQLKMIIIMMEKAVNRTIEMGRIKKVLGGDFDNRNGLKDATNFLREQVLKLETRLKAAEILD